MVAGSRYVVLLVALAAVAVGGIVALELNAPGEGQTTAENLPQDADVVADGALSGVADHRVSGTVTLFRHEGRYGLYFEQYHRPDVPAPALYLTPAPEPDSRGDVEAGLRVRGGGEFTEEGTFVVWLPADAPVEEYNGVAIWCERRGTLVGSAPLHALDGSGDGSSETATTARGGGSTTAPGAENATATGGRDAMATG